MRLTLQTLHKAFFPSSFLKELLALDLVVLAVPFAGQYQARPPELSPVPGFLPLHRGLVLVLALAFLVVTLDVKNFRNT